MIRHFSHIFFVEGLTFIVSVLQFSFHTRTRAMPGHYQRQPERSKWLRATVPWLTNRPSATEERLKTYAMITVVRDLLKSTSRRQIERAQVRGERASVHTRSVRPIERADVRGERAKVHARRENLFQMSRLAHVIRAVRAVVRSSMGSWEAKTLGMRIGPARCG